MSITTNLLSPVITDMDPIWFTVSILLRTQIIQDGIILTSTDHRSAFVPGQIEQVQEFIGNNTDPVLGYLNNLWTDDLITSYTAMLAETKLSN